MKLSAPEALLRDVFVKVGGGAEIDDVGMVVLNLASLGLIHLTANQSHLERRPEWLDTSKFTRDFRKE